MSDRYTKDIIVKAIASSSSVREAIAKLGLVANGANYKVFYKRIRKFGINISRLNEDHAVIYCKEQVSDDILTALVKDSISYRGILVKLGLNPDTNSNLTWLRGRITNLALDTSHFLGMGHMKGKRGFGSPKRTLDEILVEDSDFGSTSHLKQKLLKAGILADQCAICGITDWYGKPLSLQLDHINGRNTDNRRENLRLLCPNCHSQTATFCRRNKTTTSKQSLNKNHASSGFKKPVKEKNHCLECGKELARRESKVCAQCYHSNRSKYQTPHGKTKIKWPEDQQLLQMVKDSSYLQVSNRLGVSNTAVSKRLKKRGLM